MKGNSHKQLHQTTENSSTGIVDADVDPDVMRQDRLFKELGLRQLSKLHPSSTLYNNALGYFFVGVAVLSLLTFVYATYVSKLMPFTGIAWLDAIKRDHYFCYLIPLSLLPTSIVIYIHWLARRHFEQN